MINQMNTLFLLLSTILITFAKVQGPGDNLPDVSSKCPNTIRDIVFLMDESESISKTDKYLAVDFFTEIIKFLKVSNAQTRIAFVEFGDSANIVDFNNYDFNKQDSIYGMIGNLEAFKNKKRLTAIGKALNFTLVELFPQMRSDVDKLIILFNDGTNLRYPAPYEYAEKLKSAGVRILSIGIGPDINSKELRTLSTSGLSVTFDNFIELSNFQDQFLNYICFITDPNLEICRKEKFDLVFLLDSSKSVSEKDFNHAKQFIIHIIEGLNLRSDDNRVAVITFSDNFRIDLNFGDFNDLSILIEKIKLIKQFGNLTGIGKALKAVQSKIIPQKKSKTPFNIILITDGANNIYPRPFQIAESIKKEGANIITVGVGSDINIKELNALSSSGQILTVDSFDKLDKSLETIFDNLNCDNSIRGTAIIG